MSIRTKVLTGFFLIFTGTLLAGGLVLYSLVKENLREDIETGLFTNSAVLMEMVRSSVNVSVRNHLRAVAEKNREIVAHFHDEARKGRMTEAQAKRRAAEVLLAQHIGTTGYIYCLNSAGVLQVHPVASNVGRDVSDFAFVRQQKERRSGYLEYNWSNPGEKVPRPKALYMVYYAPWDWIISASTYREEFRELVELDDFRRSITTQRFGRDGYAFVLDATGNIVMHPHLSGSIIGLRDANGLPLVREIVARKFGKLYYWWRNPGESKPRQKIVTFNYLPEVDWIVCSSAYVEDFSAPLQYLRNVAVGAFVAVLLLGLPFSWWVGNSVTSSLRELASGFSRATEGDFSIRLPGGGAEEMKRITEYFNAFMAKLEDYDSSLRREIKDRRNAVRGEKRLRDHLQEVIDSLPAIVMGVDLENRVTLWNRQAEEALGVSRAGALGRKVTEICPMCATFLDLVETAVRERRSTGWDKVAGVRDGRTVYHAMEASPLAGGEGAVIVISDVTRRVQVEDMMVQNEKMLSVGGLAAGMAHEINNPLGAILQGSQNIQRRLSSELAANADAARDAGTDMESIMRYMEQRKVLRMLDGIRESGLRAAKIVANMLEFSRSGQASRSLHDVVTLLEKAVLLAESDYDLKKQYDFRKITLERSFEDDLPPVLCSSTEIEQVFLNVIRNAAQAMAGAGVATPMLRLAARREGQWVRVEVTDNGPGMEEEVRKRIFDPFFTTKEVGEGTGLGLSVSYFIVIDNHGGTFTVDSAPGRGATFIIRLPL